jgi:hypothetical protein
MPQALEPTEYNQKHDWNECATKVILTFLEADSAGVISNQPIDQSR